MERPHLIGMATSTPDLPLAGLTQFRLLTSDEAAQLLGVPVATLRTWRSRRRGYGPRAVHVGGCVRYRAGDLLAWIEEHTEAPDGAPPDGVTSPSGANARPTTSRRSSIGGPSVGEGGGGHGA